MLQTANCTGANESLFASVSVKGLMFTFIYILQSLPNIWCNFLTSGLMTTCWCYSISEIAWMKYKLCTPKRNLVSSASPTCRVSVSVEDAAAVAGFRNHVVICCSKDSSCIYQSMRSTEYLFSLVHKYTYIAGSRFKYIPRRWCIWFYPFTCVFMLVQ